jgi:L-asparaginase/Glu-tRNA(Gln) amidotransferase subunit D
MDPSPIGILARDIILYDGRKKRDHSLVPRFDTQLDDRVFLLKVFPGLPPQTLTRIVEMGYHGMIIEGFGSGNIPTEENALAGGILQAINQGCFVVISSQCAFGQADLSIYEVGRAAMDVGAMSAYDMTPEAALVKLAWVLGHTNESDQVQTMMGTSYVGEMSYIELNRKE